MLGLTIKDKKVIVSTKHISDVFEKEHRNVMRDVNNLKCSADFRVRNFERSSYTSKQNKNLKSFDVTRDGFAFLAMGFTGKKAAEWKEKYINAFNEMETALVRGVKSDSITDINAMLKGIEDLNKIGSVHGKGLSNYAKKKRARVLEYQEAVNTAQLVLNIK